MWFMFYQVICYGNSYGVQHARFCISFESSIYQSRISSEPACYTMEYVGEQQEMVESYFLLKSMAYLQCCTINYSQGLCCKVTDFHMNMSHLSFTYLFLSTALINSTSDHRPYSLKLIFSTKLSVYKLPALLLQIAYKGLGEKQSTVQTNKYDLKQEHHFGKQFYYYHYEVKSDFNWNVHFLSMFPQTQKNNLEYQGFLMVPVIFF